MKNLEKELELLKFELEEMKKQWAKEVKEVEKQPNFNAYSKKAAKAYNKIADRYAKQMNDNIVAQTQIENKIIRIKEEERKKLYKD